jgi:glucosyl-3-phosphoglycerate phosphatase
VLWRHGETDYNAERRFQGQRDVPLNAAGLAQARRAARYLATLHPVAIYSSDLVRASATANALARLTGLQVQLDKDLRERHGGEWEGLTTDEIRERYPDQQALWEPPGGESSEAVADRTEAALLRIAAAAYAPGSVAVVVGHGASLNLGMTRLLGLPDGHRITGPMLNCRWCQLSRRDGRWRLIEFNVAAFPEPLDATEPAETG